MAVATAQIGLKQPMRDHRGVVLARTAFDKKIANETAELFVADRRLV